MTKNSIIIACSLLSSFSVYSTENTDSKTFLLFKGLEKAIVQDLNKDEVMFAKCFNTATNPAPKMEIKQIEEESFNLSINAEKKECFHGTKFKKNLVKFYKERASVYKKPFEMENLILGTSFGEDKSNITFNMYLKKEEKEKKESLFDNDPFIKMIALSFVLRDLISSNDKNSENGTQKDNN